MGAPFSATPHPPPPVHLICHWQREKLHMASLKYLRGSHPAISSAASISIKWLRRLIEIVGVVGVWLAY